MPSMTEILGNPITDIIKSAGEIIGKFIPDPQAKQQAALELAALQEKYQEKLLEADQTFAKAQAEVIVAEASSQSWLARNWRPITMLTFVYIIAHNFVFAQLFSLKVLEIPTDMWQLLKLGIGGYIIGRSAEKVIPDTVAAYKGTPIVPKVG
jgi:hypothetical protein